MNSKHSHGHSHGGPEKEKHKKHTSFDHDVIEKEQMKQEEKALKAKTLRETDQSQNLRLKKKYVSRRKKAFEDSESDIDSNDEDYANNYKDTGDISYMDTKGNVTVLKPNIRFTSYKSVFKDLLKQTSVVTMYNIISMIINYDSTRAVTVTKKDDRTYFIKMYDLETYQMTFEEKIGGGPNQYIKMKEVQQN